MSNPAESTALKSFKEVLLRFNDEPTLANYAHYRQASRELERATRRESRKSRR
jgi:hypothetical protein